MNKKENALFLIVWTIIALLPAGVTLVVHQCVTTVLEKTAVLGVGGWVSFSWFMLFAIVGAMAFVILNQ